MTRGVSDLVKKKLPGFVSTKICGVVGSYPAQAHREAREERGGSREGCLGNSDGRRGQGSRVHSSSHVEHPFISFLPSFEKRYAVEPSIVWP